MIGYVTLGTNDMTRAARFYDDLLAVVGANVAHIGAGPIPAFVVSRYVAVMLDTAVKWIGWLFRARAMFRSNCSWTLSAVVRS